MKHWKEIIGDLLIIGTGAAFLVNFILIAATGGYLAVENNPYILYCEIALMILVIAIGVDRFIDDARRRK